MDGSHETDKKIAMCQYSFDEIHSWRDALSASKRLERFFVTVKPFDAFGIRKVRIGGASDGGYVSLDPGVNGVAYSFGISNWAPWDLEMALRGFQVYQYDGSVTEGPDKHPNLHFNQYYINGYPTSKEGTKTISDIFIDLGHQENNDIVLQMDIEGEEWPFFEYILEAEILKFKQIIVEFHGHLLIGQHCDRYLSILEKINKTHCCVHIHGVNFFSSLGFFPGNLLYTSGFEISYARRSDYKFKESTEFYPTSLDGKSHWEYPEIILGSFVGL